MVKIKFISKIPGPSLTIGNIYEAVSVPLGGVKDKAFLLKNDKGGLLPYPKHFFEIVVEVDEDLVTLEKTYITLLKMPICIWRIQNQNIYCDLRNRIAEKTNQPIRDIQEKYETLAND